MEKTVNYTAEMVAELKAKYAEGATVKALATLFGKTERSVVAKLSHEGVYMAPSKSAKAGRVHKDQLVLQLEQALDLPVGTLASLEKATQPALAALVMAVVPH